MIISNNFFKLVWRNLGEIVIKYVCSDVPLTEGLAKKRSQAAFSLYCHKLCLSRKAVFDSTQFSSLVPAIKSTQSFFHQFTSFTKKPRKELPLAGEKIQSGDFTKKNRWHWQIWRFWITFWKHESFSRKICQVLEYMT